MKYISIELGFGNGYVEVTEPYKVPVGKWQGFLLESDQDSGDTKRTVLHPVSSWSHHRLCGHLRDRPYPIQSTMLAA